MGLNLLKPGTKAPAIKAKDAHGEKFSWKDYKGSKVVLYFYPKDDTPGCTKESCNLRDNYRELLKRGIKVVGVSKDGEASHQKFIEKYNLPFPLIADVDLETVNAYGVWGEKKNYGRTYMGTHRVTYIIDENGKIEHVIEKVKTADHTAQILELLGEEC